VLDDGTLSIGDVGLQHVGNYSCHDQRWSDVSQTHILDVHGTVASDQLTTNVTNNSLNSF